jgi:hypothetical protein
MRLMLVVGLVIAAPAPLTAQWHLTLGAGVAGASGHAFAPEDSDAPELRPAPTRDLAIGIGRDHGAWRVAIRGRRTHADLVIAGATAGIITTDVLRATAVGIELGRRLAGARDAAQAHLLVGIARERWSFVGLEDEARSVTLLTAALEGEVPLYRRMRGVVRVEAGTGPSLFEADELPDGFETRSGRRTALHLGIRVVR